MCTYYCIPYTVCMLTNMWILQVYMHIYTISTSTVNLWLATTCIIGDALVVNSQLFAILPPGTQADQGKLGDLLLGNQGLEYLHQGVQVDQATSAWETGDFLLCQDPSLEKIENHQNALGFPHCCEAHLDFPIIPWLQSVTRGLNQC